MQVRVQNFQSIKDSGWLEIKGFTVLVGKTNIGKSALLRAIKCALENANGTDVVRKGAKFASVHIKRDGLDLLWEKGKGHTKYVINGKEYTKASKNSSGTPEEIKQAGFYPVPLGSDEMWVQLATQFNTRMSTPVFLLDKPGSQVAELISRASRLDVYSLANKNCVSRLKKDKELRTLRESDRSLVAVKLDAMRSFPEVKASVHELETYLSGIGQQNDELARLEQYLAQLVICSKAITALIPVTKVNVPVAPAFGGITDIEALEKSHTQFEQTTRSVEALAPVNDVALPVLGVDAAALEEVDSLDRMRSQWEASDAAVTKLLPVGSIEVPSAPNALTDLDDLTVLFDRLIKAASAVEAVKKVESIEVPVAPPMDTDLDALGSLQDRYVALEGAVEKLAGIEQVVIPDTGSLYDNISELAALETLLLRVAEAAQSVGQFEKEFADTSDELAKAQAAEQEIKNELGVCPTCDTPFQTHAAHV